MQQIFNNTNTKKIIILLSFLVLGAIIFTFTNKHSSEVFEREKTALEQRISENRKIREIKKAEQEKIYNAWKKEDELLEQSINSDKERISALKLLLGEKDSSIIPVAKAEENTSWTADGTPESAEPPKRNIIQCAIGKGSHDVRPLAKNYPGVAGWKNNNTSWITVGSKDLEKAYNENWIKWFVGTKRPANEWNYYYGFPDLENWLKAKILIIRRSYTNATISQYLTKWWTDWIPANVPMDRKVWSLTDSELIELALRQIRKESWKAMSDYIRNNVLDCK